MKTIATLLLISSLVLISCNNERVTIVIPLSSESYAGYQLALAELENVLAKNHYLTSIHSYQKESPTRNIW